MKNINRKAEIVKCSHFKKNGLWKKKLLAICAILFLFIKIASGQSTQLWGMGNAGGINNQYGYIYKMNLDGSNFTSVHYFNWTDGAYPKGSLVKSSNGNLYGMTEKGGAYGKGVAFLCNGGVCTVIYDFGFGGSDGQYPCGSLLVASNGIIYGVTPKGGSNFNGILFAISPANGHQLAKIKDFNLNNANGQGPSGSLMQASNGLIYGTSYNGGYNQNGFVFSYNPLNADYHEYSINGLLIGGSGSNPECTLVQRGNYLYGTTSKGGACNKGTVFKFNMTSHNVTTVMEFCGNQSNYGDYPTGLLNVTATGEFYGMTQKGGAQGTSNDDGVMFKFTDYSNLHTTPVYFDGTNKGKEPHGGMVAASDGNFYGTTVLGGTNNFGVAFRYNPTNNSFFKTLDFFNANSNGQLIELPCTPGAVTPGNITSAGGIPKVCPGDVRIYAVPAVAGLTYTWTAFPGATINSGQGTNTITVTYSNAFVAPSGSLQVIASNGICTSAPVYLVIYPNSPDQPGSISVSGGLAAVCPGDVRTYSVPLVVFGTTLTWTAFTGTNILSGQGTSTISASYSSAFTAASGTLSVTATNVCGTSAPRTLVISRNNPVKPGTISGSSTVCSGQFSQYAISTVANATSYSWTWPSGATASLGTGGTSIMVHFGSTGGNVTAQSYNACGFSVARTSAISVTCREGENTIQETNFGVFPNPTNGLTTLKFNSKENQNCRMLITDLTGRMILKEQINTTEGVNEYSLDVSKLMNGIYMIKIQTSEGESIKRIIKN